MKTVVLKSTCTDTPVSTRRANIAAMKTSGFVGRLIMVRPYCTVFRRVPLVSLRVTNWSISFSLCIGVQLSCRTNGIPSSSFRIDSHIKRAIEKRDKTTPDEYGRRNWNGKKCISNRT